MTRWSAALPLAPFATRRLRRRRASRRGREASSAPLVAPALFVREHVLEELDLALRDRHAGVEALLRLLELSLELEDVLLPLLAALHVQTQPVLGDRELLLGFAELGAELRAVRSLRLQLILELRDARLSLLRTAPEETRHRGPLTRLGLVRLGVEGGGPADGLEREDAAPRTREACRAGRDHRAGANEDGGRAHVRATVSAPVPESEADGERGGLDISRQLALSAAVREYSIGNACCLLTMDDDRNHMPAYFG